MKNLKCSLNFFRVLNDYARRIDESSNKVHKVEDLFAPALVGLRSKLQDVLKTNLDDNPYLSGALDFAWRKGSYEVLHLAKKLKKGPNWSQLEATYVKSHLIQSFGYFQNIVFLLGSGPDFEHQNDFGFLSEDKPKSQNTSKNLKKATFKCLMFMGDLTRYQLEFNEDKESTTKLSKKYYQMAISVDPDHGQPFNQLAALSGSQSYGIIAVYNYMRW